MFYMNTNNRYHLFFLSNFLRKFYLFFKTSIVSLSLSNTHTYTHIHTHLYIHICKYNIKCVRVKNEHSGTYICNHYNCLYIA